MRRGRILRAAAAMLGAAGLALLIAGLWRFGAPARQERARAAIEAGRLVPGPCAPPALLAARIAHLLAASAPDPAEALANHAAACAPATLRARLLTTIGNERLRQAMAVYAILPFRKVKPMIAAARYEYRLAATLDPDDWNARYDFALASELLPARETYQRSNGAEMSHDKAVWPDLPGVPNGMP